MKMAKIKIESSLYDRIKKAVDIAGYSSTQEFITHIIEKELAQYETQLEDDKVTERLKGLGYID
jgi:metal-responsive CopG/Arc/MetJ family transcriptional regulator